MSGSFYMPLKPPSGRTWLQVRLPEPLYPYFPSIHITHSSALLTIYLPCFQEKEAISLFLLNGGSIHSAINASILTPNRFHPDFFFFMNEEREDLLHS